MADGGRTDSLEIRRLAPRDEPGWRPLWDGYLRFYGEGLPDVVTRATFERLCAQTDGMTGLVAVRPGEALVGLTHVVFHASTWTTGGYCYLEDLFVAEEWRGRGVARALIEAVYSEADERGAARVYWHTEEFNASARRLYERVARRSAFLRYER